MSVKLQRIIAKYSLFSKSSLSAAAYSRETLFAKQFAMRQLCATNSLTEILVGDNFLEFELALGQTNSCGLGKFLAKIDNFSGFSSD